MTEHIVLFSHCFLKKSSQKLLSSQLKELRKLFCNKSNEIFRMYRAVHGCQEKRLAYLVDKYISMIRSALSLRTSLGTQARATNSIR